MDPTLITMATAFGTSLATNAGSQLFSGPMQTLNDWWYVKFGHKSAEEKALLLAAQEQKVDTLKSEIFEKVSEIPVEHLQEPPISILGPAIEASRFYIDEDEIRKMFASLISSSLDQRKNKTIHHSFVEIIKQMSPNDATILSLFSSTEYLPFVDYKITSDNSGSTTRIAELIFMELDTEYDKHSISLTNLKRLGLIDIRRGEWLTDDSKYDKFLNSDFYFYLKDNNILEDTRKENILKVEQFGRDVFLSFNNMTDHELDKILEKKDIDIDKGILSVTPLGSAFIKICF